MNVCVSESAIETTIEYTTGMLSLNSTAESALNRLPLGRWMA